MQTSKKLLYDIRQCLKSPTLGKLYTDNDPKKFYKILCENYVGVVYEGVEMPLKLMALLLWLSMGGAEEDFMKVMLNKPVYPRELLEDYLCELYRNTGGKINIPLDLQKDGRYKFSGFGACLSTAEYGDYIVSSTESTPQTCKTQPPSKEDTMKAFETIDYVYGNNVKEMTDQQLIAALKKAEGERDALGTVKTPSKKIKALQADWDKAIAKIVEALDARA